MIAKHFKILFFYFSIFWSGLLCAQTPAKKVIDSLKVALINETADTSRVNILNNLSIVSYWSSSQTLRLGQHLPSQSFINAGGP